MKTTTRKSTVKEYQVWCWHAPYSDNPQAWTVQYFDDIKDAYQFASETVADEIQIEVWEEVGWVNDHIKKQKLLQLKFS